MFCLQKKFWLNSAADCGAHLPHDALRRLVAAQVASWGTPLSASAVRWWHPARLTRRSQQLICCSIQRGVLGPRPLCSPQAAQLIELPVNVCSRWRSRYLYCCFCLYLFLSVVLTLVRAALLVCTNSCIILCTRAKSHSTLGRETRGEKWWRGRGRGERDPAAGPGRSACWFWCS